MKRPPASGERAALSGYLPQYEVAASLILRALTQESLDWFAIMDLEAGKLDDFQLATPGRLDAYQIKWSLDGGQISWSDLSPILVDIIRDRRMLAENNPDRLVVGHLYTNRVASRSRINKHPGIKLAIAINQLFLPAINGEFISVKEIPDQVKPLWIDFVERCSKNEEELLHELRFIRIELGERLPSQLDLPGREGDAYIRDLEEIRTAILNIAIDPKRPTRISRPELVKRLGGHWAMRLRLRSEHEFPLPQSYQPVQSTVTALSDALERFSSGYVALIGSPGSGKSTLLTQELRYRDDVVARYYAYVPGRPDLGATRSEASSFLHDLVLTLERRGLNRGASPVDYDVAVLVNRLQKQLIKLHDRYLKENQRSIILIDGLDHAEREKRDESFLQFLPRPEDIPEGVLFVIGSQNVRMLHPDVLYQLDQPGRTIDMARLDITSVAEIAKARDIYVDPEKLWKTSDGHPLILVYLLNELENLPAAEQYPKLIATPNYGGDIERLYRHQWNEIERDGELVELLALVSRIRREVDLVWLREKNQPSTAIRKLSEQFSFLFRRENERWYFFHDSFRLFLHDYTVRVNNQFDRKLHKYYHSQLAKMCSDTSPENPRHWDILFHLSAAEEHERVLETATPDFFRDQLLALRPPELVGEDIRLAARSLAIKKNPIAIVRLAIAANELFHRDYYWPDREKFLSLLINIGLWRTAVAYLEVERESFGEEDDRAIGLRISLILYHKNLHEEANKIFTANEPFDVLSGRIEQHRLRGVYQLLYAWARAAAVLRGPDTILNAANNLRLPIDETAYGHMNGDSTPKARAGMLASAVIELDRCNRSDEADICLSALDPNIYEDRRAWIRALSHRWEKSSDNPDKSIFLVTHRFSPDEIDYNDRILIADGLLKANQTDEARQWIADLSQPPPTEAGLRTDLRKSEGLRYRLNLLLEALGQSMNPDVLVPDATEESKWGYVRIARITITIAQLHGRVLAGDRLTVNNFMAMARNLLGIIDLAGTGDYLRRYEMSNFKPRALAQLLYVADLHGREVVVALWNYYEQRWNDLPINLSQEWYYVLSMALRIDAISHRAIERINQIESIVEQTTYSGQLPSSLLDLAELMIKADLKDEAQRIVRKAISETLTISHRKDYQLTQWIDLLGPRLDGDSGANLARWLATAIIDLHKKGTDAPIEDAVKRLLLADSIRRPGHAWLLGAHLENNGLIDWIDRLAILLESQIVCSIEPLWWIVLTDQLVPISEDAPSHFLQQAADLAAAQHGRQWLLERLNTLLSRVEVEAPPQERNSWKLAIADCAAEHKIEFSKLNLPDELHPDIEPPQSREDKRDAFLADHNTVELLFDDARQTDLSSDLSNPWAEAVKLLARNMNLEQIKEARDIFSTSRDVLRINLHLARRALELEAADIAKELAEKVLRESEPRNWLRHYGNTTVGALKILATLNPSRIEELAYHRFAEDAANDKYLLSEIARDLDQYLGMFDISDHEALGKEVESHLKLILNINESDSSFYLEDTDNNALNVLAHTGIELLALPYRLSITTAQRALVSELLEEIDITQTYLAEALESKDEELVLRILSVIEAAIALGARLNKRIIDAIEVWSESDYLALRLCSRRIIKSLGRMPVPLPKRELPASYFLEVPDLEKPRLKHEMPLARDDLERILAIGKYKLEKLAKRAGVDVGLLNARVTMLVRSLAAGKSIEDWIRNIERSLMGWSYFKPSVIIWERALGRVACELSDAEAISPELAMLLSTGPMYDPMLIASRPLPRPEEIVSIPESDDMWIDPDRWLKGLESAEERLAKSTHGGWIVIGEHTELHCLDRNIPKELRAQSLGVLRLLRPEDRFPSYEHLQIWSLDSVPPREGSMLLIGHFNPTFRGPSRWLMLHPQVARDCGWQPDTEAIVGWRDNDGPLVRSIWWRSGWIFASNWTGHEEVGEGWMVLAQARAIEQIAELVGGDLGIAWQAERG